MFLFLRGVFGQVTPGILLLWIWIVKQFPQISGFKCNNDVKTLSGGRIGLVYVPPYTLERPVQDLPRRTRSALGIALPMPKPPVISPFRGLRAIASNLLGDPRVTLTKRPFTPRDGPCTPVLS